MELLHRSERVLVIRTVAREGFDPAQFATLRMLRPGIGGTEIIVSRLFDGVLYTHRYVSGEPLLEKSLKRDLESGVFGCSAATDLLAFGGGSSLQAGAQDSGDWIREEGMDAHR